MKKVNSLDAFYDLETKQSLGILSHNEIEYLVTEYINFLTTTHSTSIIRKWLHANPRMLNQNLLTYAVIANRKDIVSLLLRMNVDVNTRDKLGRTAAHYAVANRRIEICEILLYDKESKVEYLADLDGHTPLDLALLDSNYRLLFRIFLCFPAKVDGELASLFMHNKEMCSYIRSNEFVHYNIETLSCINSISSKSETLADFVQLNSASECVFRAIQCGDINKLKILTMPKSKSGFGLALRVKHTDFKSPIHVALQYNQSEMLLELIMPISEGGFGLNFLKYRNEPDYVNKLTATMKMMVERGEREYLTDTIEQIFPIGRELRKFGVKVSEILHWANAIILRSRSETLKDYLAAYYKEKIKLHLMQENLTVVEIVLEAFEELSPNEGYKFLADIYTTATSYVNAFACNLALFQNKYPLSNEVLVNMADLVLLGFVILDAHGYIDELLTKRQGGLTEPVLRAQGMNLQHMQDRAIKAYGFLEGIETSAASSIRKILHQILSGNLGVDLSRCCEWTADVIAKFKKYYEDKSPALCEVDCQKAVLHEKKKPESCSLRLFGKKQQSKEKDYCEGVSKQSTI